MNFYRVNLENRDLHGQNFDGADFRKANLRMTILEDISCEPAKVKKTWPKWLSLVGVLFFLIPPVQSSYIEEMKSTNFSEADLTGSILRRAKLREANFHSAILKSAILSSAILVNADLSEADLRNADLSYTDMSGALLYKTNLEGANLTGAKLDGTDFESANLKNAILHNLDLQKAKYLNSANMTGAITSNSSTHDSVEREFVTPIQNKLADVSERIIIDSASGRTPSGSFDRNPIIVGALLGLLSALICAYLVPVSMVGFEALGYRSVTQYLTQAGFLLCVPIIALWTVPLGILGALIGQRIGLKTMRPTTSMILMILGGLTGSSIGFLIGIPLMIVVVGLGS